MRAERSLDKMRWYTYADVVWLRTPSGLGGAVPAALRRHTHHWEGRVDKIRL